MAYLCETTLRAVRNPGSVTLPRDLETPKSREKSLLDLRAAKLPTWPQKHFASNDAVD